MDLEIVIAFAKQLDLTGSPNQYNAVVWAIKQGSKELVEYFVAQGFELDSWIPDLLTKAASAGHLEIVKYLTVRSTIKHCYKPAILKAAVNGNFKVARFLLEATGNPQETADQLLTAAIKMRSVAAFKFFQRRGAQVNNYTLAEAIKANNAVLVEIILNDMYCPLDNTCLQLAQKHPHIAQLLIDRGASLDIPDPLESLYRTDREAVQT